MLVHVYDNMLKRFTIHKSDKTTLYVNVNKTT